MNTVLLGGNGYIGRNITKYWLKEDKNMNFIVLSRSGENQLKDERIKNIKVDVTNLDEVRKALDTDITYIIDLVGGLGDTKEEIENINLKPAQIMKTIAEEKNIEKMGYIGGNLRF